MIRKVVLPAAGHGTRLRPLTRFIPKEMLPVGDRLVIQHVLAECRAAGLDCILAVVSRSKPALVEAMETIVGDEAGEALYPQLCTVNQRVQGGLGHAVLHAEAFAGSDPFAVALADTIIEGGARPLLARLIAAHEAHGAVATVAVEEVSRERLSRYGVVRPDPGAPPPGKEPFRILDLVEKPAPEAAPSNLAISARYVFAPVIFDALRALLPEAGAKREAPQELQLTDAIAALARAGHTVLGLRLGEDERRRDIGSLESYAQAFADYSPCRP